MTRTASVASPKARMAILWRLLTLLTRRYRDRPTGQVTVALTVMLMNQAGRPPTMTELSRATGFPKSTLSRYVAAEISAGRFRETIDQRDRRRRLISLTPEGDKEWRLLSRRLHSVFSDITQTDEAVWRTGQGFGTDVLVERMARVVEDSRSADN